MTYEEVKTTYASIIGPVADRYGVRPELIAAVIFVESSGVPTARAKTTTARGLMQMTKAACADLGVDWEALDDPAVSIPAGTRYLARLLHYFRGNERDAVEAYYQGLGNQLKGDASPIATAAFDYGVRVLSNANASDPEVRSA